MGRRRAPELYRAPFPLYALQVDPRTGLLIAAGGGGAAKTGIKNGVVRARVRPGPGAAATPGGSRGAGGRAGAAPQLRTLPPAGRRSPGPAGHPTRISAEKLKAAQGSGEARR